MIKESISYKIIILFALLFLFSCSASNTDWSEMTTKDIIKSLSGQKVNIPIDLLIVNEDELVVFDSLNLYESKLKIFSLISGDCEKCINNINLWKKIEQELNPRRNVKIYFVILTTDPEFFIERYLPMINTSSSILIDKEYNFLKINNFPPYNRFQTFLLNDNNEIVLIGDPFYNEKSLKLYVNTIKNY